MAFELPEIGYRTFFDKCKAVYFEMYDNSILDSEDNRLWEGYTTHIFRKYNIGNNEHGKIMKQLLSTGCIVMIRKGAGRARSCYVLVKEPDIINHSQIPKALAKGGENPVLVMQKLVEFEGQLKYLIGVVESHAYAINMISGDKFPSLVQDIEKAEIDYNSFSEDDDA